MRSLATVVLVVAVASGACTSGESAPVGESTSSMVTTVTATSLPAATTTTSEASTTTTTRWVPESHTLGSLAATPYETEPLVWRNTGVTFERRRSHEYWVGSMGDRFVFVEFDWPLGGLVVSTSVDGVEWERASLPETIGADEVPLAEWAVVHVAAGEAGVVVVLNREPVGREQLEPSHLLISTEGLTFVESDLSALQGHPNPTNPASIAAGAAGFAVVTEDPTSRIDPVNWMYVSADGVEWQLVDIPDTYRDLGWVEGLGDGWITQGPYRRSPDNAYPVYVIGPEGGVELRTAPWDSFPQSWGDQVLMEIYSERLIEEHLGEAPSFYATADASAWWRIPFPDQGPFSEQDYAAWYVETIAGDGPDDQLLVLGCGDRCVGAWEFYGNNFLPVTIQRDDWGIEISGNYVSYFNGTAWKSINDASDFYDPATETLTIVEDGETIASITCDQMRQAAIDAPWHAGLGDGLTTLPDEALWHSYNGTSWHEQAVDDLFGTESYVFAAAMTTDLALAVVTPNGDRQVADPLGCELGLYAPEQPLEIWIAELP